MDSSKTKLEEKVPWSSVVRPMAASSLAPGPPFKDRTQNAPKKKSPLKLAAKLGSGASSKITAGYSPETRPEGDGAKSQTGSELKSGDSPAAVGDVEGWNPMVEDYNSRSFNSYVKGPGVLLESSRKVGTTESRDNITLFVDNIPIGVTKEGLRNLFSKCGKVRKASVINQNNPQRTTTYGFVDFATIREADAAIYQFNKFDMGNGAKLIVKVSEKMEDRRKRLEQKREEEAFFSTLHCGRHGDHDDGDDDDDFELTEGEAEKSVKNPFIPKYSSHKSTSVSSPTPNSPGHVHTATESSPPGQTTLSSSAGASSQLAQPSITNSTGLQASPKKQHSSLSSSTITTSRSQLQPKNQNRPCKVCGKPCTSRCRVCKTPYCGIGCQEQDWVQHKEECKELAGRKNTKPGEKERMSDSEGSQQSVSLKTLKHSETSIPPSVNPSPNFDPIKGILKIAESSDDDEGFEISLPDNLMDMKKSLWAARQNSNRDQHGLSGEEETQSGKQSPAPISAEGGPIAKEVDMLSSSQSEVPNSVRGGICSVTKVDVLPSDQQPSSPLSSPSSLSLNTSPQLPLETDQSSPASLTTVDLVGSAKGGFLVPWSEIMSLFDNPTVHLSSFPLDAQLPPKFNAVVTSILSACRFSVVVSSIETKQFLKKLEAFGASGSMECLHLRELTIGSKCGMKNRAGFFRVQVTAVYNNTFHVTLYDFGGHHDVSRDDTLVHLPEDLLSPPSLRHRCCLFRISMANSKESSQFLYSLVRSKLVTIETNSLVKSKANPAVSFLLCDSMKIAGSSSLDIYEAVKESEFSRDSAPPTSLAPFKSSSSSSSSSTIPYSRPTLRLHFSRDVPFHQPPRDQKFEIFPTVVSNPGLFWAQVIHDNSKNLLRLQEDLNKRYQNCQHLTYVPTIGEMCVAKFSEDQKFYRVNVQCVNYNGTVDVHYVDYGNSETVTTEQLWYMEPIYLSLPKQALRMSLYGVGPISGSWSDNAVAHFKSKVTKRAIEAEIMAVTEREIFVKLYDPESPSKTLNEKLVSSNLAEFKTSHGRESGIGKRQPLTMKGVSVSIREGENVGGSIVGSGPASPQSSPRPFPAHANQNDKTAQDTLTTGRDKLSPLSPGKSSPRSVKDTTGKDGLRHLTLREGEETQVTVTHVVDPTEFWIRTLNCQELQELLVKINSTQHSPLIKPRVGNLCLCEFAEDHCIYRCQVESVEGSTATVKFIDYGNVESIPISEIYSMAEEFKSLPAQGIRCTLNNVKNPAGKGVSWSKTSVEFFKSLVLNSDKALTVKCIKSFVVKHVVDVSVPMESGAADLLELFAAAGHCRLWQGEGRGKDGQRRMVLKENTKVEDPPVSRQSFGAASNDHFYPPSSRLDVIKFPSNSDYFKAIVSEVSSPHSLFIQPGLCTLEALNELSKSLNAYLTSSPYTPPSSPPKKGSLCCAKFSQDGLWYRVEVIDSKPGVCKVVFVDYGNTDTVPLSDIVPCPRQFLATPKMSVECALNGVSPPTITGDWSTEAGAFLKRMVSDRPLQVKVAGRSSVDRKPLVDLMDTSGSSDVNMANELIGKGYAVAEGNKDPGDLPKAESQKAISCSAKDYPPSSLLNSIEFPSSSDYFLAVVSEVSSPHSLFLQPGLSTLQALNELSQSLNTYLTSSPYTPPSSPPKKGSLCCAKFSQDHLWYRVEVIDSKPGVCKVVFVDYGNTDTVPLSDIAPCPQQFLATPKMSVECALNGIGPPTTTVDWSTEAGTFLKQKVSNRPLQAKIAGRSSVGGKPLVDLMDTSGSSDVNMAAELIASGFAMAVNTKELFKTASQDADFSSAKDYPPSSKLNSIDFPSSSDYFLAVVSEVSSPHSLFIQPGLSTLQALNELSQSLNAHLTSTPTTPPSSPPKKGSLSCAKFSQDGLWYRVEVIDSKPGVCKVVFVDYGNTDTVPLSDIAPCPQQFLATPKMSVECALNGVSPPTTTGDWSTEAGAFLKQKVSNRPLQVKAAGRSSVGGKPLVDLMDTSGSSDVNMAAELIASGFAMAENTKELFKTASQEADFSSAKDYPPSSKLNSIDFPSSSDYFLAVVSEVSSPHSLFIQPGLSTLQTLNELSQSLNAHLTSAPTTHPSSPPKKGSLCCAKFSQDGLWYRVEVIDSKPGVCKVVFVDYGNTDTVPLSDIAPCPQQFLATPKMSVECALNGVSPPTTTGDWSTEASAFLKQMVSGRPLQAKVAGRSSVGGKPLVDLTDTSDSSDVNIAAELIGKGYAMTKGTRDSGNLSKAESQEAISCSAKDYPPSSLLNSIDFPSSSDYFLAVVSEVSSPQSFFIQPGLSTLQALNELSQSLNTHLTSTPTTPPSSPPKKGSLCCAKFSQDHVWYRGEVIDSKPGICRVCFIDYGNTDTVPLSDIAPCPQQFLETPKMSVECALNGVSPPTTTGDWSTEAGTFLKQKVSNRPLQAKAAGRSSVGGKPLVDLMDTSGSSDVNMAAELIASGFAMAENTKELFKTASQEADFSSARDYPPSSKLNSIEFPSSSNYFLAVVSEVSSPHSLFIQPGLSTLQALNELSQSLNAHLTSTSTTPPSSPPKKGSLCCAKFSQDHLWYRVEVIDSKPGVCKVVFVDYGNTDTVPLSDIAPCPQQFLETPKMSVECALNGVSPPTTTGDWSTEAGAFLKQKVSNRPLQAKATSRSSVGGKPLVDLMDTSGSSDVNMAAELIASGYAMAENTKDPGNLPKAELQESISCSAKDYPPSSLLNSIEFPSSSDYFLAVVSEVSGPHSLFLQPGLSTLQALNELSQSLNTHFTSLPYTPSFSPPKKGSLCCAKFSQDSLWYRVEVIDSKPGVCKVVFVDYGNTDTVPLSDIAPCPQQFLATPKMSVECALNGVSPPTTTGDWSTEAGAFLKQKVSNRPLQAKVAGRSSVGGKPLVDLMDTSGSSDVNMAAELIASGFAVAEECQSKSDTSRATPISSVPSTPSLSILTSILPSSSFRANVTDVTSPGLFFLQEANLESLQALKNLMDQLQVFYSDPLVHVSFEPVVGAFCCAKFTADGCWYRCQVLEIADECSLVKVKYIDYGNTEDLFIDRICPLDPKFASLPSMAVQCFLGGIKPVLKSGWPSIASKAFKALVTGGSNEVVMAKVMHNKESEAVAVELFLDENCSKSVSQELIQKKLAVSSPLPIEVTSEAVITSANSAAPQSPPLSTSLPSATLPSSEFPVVGTYAVSPSEFYIQVIDPEVTKSFIKMSQEFNEKAPSSSSYRELPAPGTICIAKNSEGSWYRARVEHQVSHNCVEVFFLDFGDKEGVALSSLRKIPRRFLSLPSQGIKAGLFGLSTEKILSSTTEQFKQLLVNKRFTCRVIEQLPLLVKLFDGTSGLDLGKELALSK